MVCSQREQNKPIMVRKIQFIAHLFMKGSILCAVCVCVCNFAKYRLIYVCVSKIVSRIFNVNMWNSRHVLSLRFTNRDYISKRRMFGIYARHFATFRYKFQKYGLIDFRSFFIFKCDYYLINEYCLLLFIFNTFNFAN